MTVRALRWLPPGSPEWLDQRQNHLGGSEVAAVLGVSPWRSPLTLWHRKRGEVPEQAASQSMHWGNLLEKIVLRVYADEAGITYSRRPRTWGDNWRIANVDALTSDGRIVEVKTVDSHAAWEWGPNGSDDPAAIPAYYRVQVCWYLSVVPRVQPDATLLALIGGNTLRTYTVRPRPGELDGIRERAWAFVRSLPDGPRPDIDSAADTFQTIRELHPDIDDIDRELPPAAVGAWQVAHDDLIAAAVARDLARSRVADLMGSARYGCIDGRRVVRRQSKNGGTPYPTLIKETL